MNFTYDGRNNGHIIAIKSCIPMFTYDKVKEYYLITCDSLVVSEVYTYYSIESLLSLMHYIAGSIVMLQHVELIIACAKEVMCWAQFVDFLVHGPYWTHYIL